MGRRRDVADGRTDRRQRRSDGRGPALGPADRTVVAVRLGGTYAAPAAAGKPALHSPWGQPGPGGGRAGPNCAQLGDKPVDPAPDFGARAPLNCGDAGPPVWSQKSWRPSRSPD